MKNLFPFGVAVFYFMLKLVLGSFVFGLKEEYTPLPDDLLNLWVLENRFSWYYGKFDMFSIIVIPDCEDNELIEVTISSILLTSNRNLLHEIIVLSNECRNSNEEIKNNLSKSFFEKPLIKVIETDAQELGDLQNVGVINSSGEILLFIPVAALFPPNWMSPIIRGLNDNLNSIITPRFKKLDKKNWKFSQTDAVYSPKIMFTKKDFQLINIHSRSNKVPLFFSRIFAIKRSWWDKISKFSDPTINLIFKTNINLDISLRGWNCGGRVVQAKDLSFGVAKINNPQPSYEIRQILLESWIDKSLADIILKNSTNLSNFMNLSSGFLSEALINKRVQMIKHSNCELKSHFISNFYDELNEFRLIEYPRNRIVFGESGLCFTEVEEKNNIYRLKLSKCTSNNSSQLFHIDKKRNIIRNIFSNRCMEVAFRRNDHELENREIIFGECDQNNLYTHFEYWKNRITFGSYCIQASAESSDLFLRYCLSEDDKLRHLQEYKYEKLEEQNII
ncbi:Glycosyl transferase family 2 family protein [Cryptosporidium felis]|nr:Glycosyl transferase family 2 family protein [Cryptosporidium felis]